MCATRAIANYFPYGGSTSYNNVKRPSVRPMAMPYYITFCTKACDCYECWKAHVKLKELRCKTRSRERYGCEAWQENLPSTPFFRWAAALRLRSQLIRPTTLWSQVSIRAPAARDEARARPHHQPRRTRYSYYFEVRVTGACHLLVQNDAHGHNTITHTRGSAGTSSAH